VPCGVSHVLLPTVQVDKAVVDALASALEASPEAGSAALRAAVRRHAIVDVQVRRPALPSGTQLVLDS
jgi:hypothetical protein